MTASYLWRYGRVLTPHNEQFPPRNTNFYPLCPWFPLWYARFLHTVPRFFPLYLSGLSKTVSGFITQYQSLSGLSTLSLRLCTVSSTQCQFLSTIFQVALRLLYSSFTTPPAYLYPFISQFLSEYLPFFHTIPRLSPQLPFFPRQCMISSTKTSSKFCPHYLRVP